MARLVGNTLTPYRSARSLYPGPLGTCGMAKPTHGAIHDASHPRLHSPNLQRQLSRPLPAKPAAACRKQDQGGSEWLRPASAMQVIYLALAPTTITPLPAPG